MAREPDPARDVVSLARLVPVIRRLAPEIVNAGTPKAGLLGMLAARATGVPIRIYLLRGLRLETATGNLRRVLATTERIASACAHDVVCNSPSLLRTAVAGGYVSRAKAIVVGAGSSNGVDTARFSRTEALAREGERRFAEIGITRDEKVIAFVGRLAKDKGIAELLDAYARVRAEIPIARLALLGADLADEKPDPEISRRVAAAPGVVVTKTIADLAPFYARIDVLAFPSHREGMPNVPIEAACAEVPVVGYRSTGVVDAVADGVTGTLVARGDVDGLTRGILGYLRDPA
jgi:glycosyltransferase involved in cell wall biosynthesis